MNKLFFLFSAMFIGTLAVAQTNDTAFSKYIQPLPESELSFAMLPVPGGSFMMGSPDADAGKKADEQPQVKVTVDSFWMGMHEVTYDEYQIFVLDESISYSTLTDAVTRPSTPYLDMSHGMGKTGGFPAVSMQHLGAIMYCKWLYTKTGIFYRLPTEAEWEYANRAGATTVYPFGNDASLLGEYAWYKENSENKYHKIGQKKPNAWGFHDMQGNVAEWVLDQYDENYFKTIADSTDNPIIRPTKRNPRVVRGGSYKDDAKALRSASRESSSTSWNRRDPQVPKSRWWNADAPFVGFRLVRPVNQPTAAEAEAFFNSYTN